MEYTHDIDGNIAIFQLEGSLLSEADREKLKKDFSQHMEKGINYFLINLDNLKHVNSTGLGIFITLYTKVRGKGGEMVMTGPQDSIRNLLEITKLNSVFNITDTQEEGLERLRAHQ